MNQTTASPAPINERADILDVLRGFALLGICLANAGYFSLYIFQKPETKNAFFSAPVDRWLSYFHMAFIDGKFYSLFSLLFGIGFSIIFLRNKLTGKNGLAIFYRRLFILLIFGLCHSLLLWDGDILLFYALAGILLPLFRNSSDRTLIKTAIILLLSPLLFDVLKIVSNGRWNISNPFLQQALAIDKKNVITEENVSNWLIVHDSYTDLLRWCQSGVWWSWQLRLDSNRAPKVLAMFLLGLYVGKNYMYAELEKYRPLLKKVQRIGLGLGIAAGIAHAYFEFDKQSLPKIMGIWDTITYALNVVPLSLGYTATIALFWLDGKFKNSLRLLVPVGRMALTNYIMQTVLGIIIYFGIGLGLGGKVGPLVYMFIAIGIFILQVLYSHWWMRRFNYGPLEWIWRMLTYGKKLKLIKNKSRNT